MDQASNKNEEVMIWKEIHFQCHFLKSKTNNTFKDIAD